MNNRSYFSTLLASRCYYYYYYIYASWVRARFRAPIEIWLENEKLTICADFVAKTSESRTKVSFRRSHAHKRMVGIRGVRCFWRTYSSARLRHAALFWFILVNRRDNYIIQLYVWRTGLFSCIPVWFFFSVRMRLHVLFLILTFKSWCWRNGCSPVGFNDADVTED